MLPHGGPFAFQGVVCVAHAQLLDGLCVRVFQLAGNAEDVHQRIGFLLFVGLGLLKHCPDARQRESQNHRIGGADHGDNRAGEVV